MTKDSRTTVGIDVGDRRSHFCVLDDAVAVAQLRTLDVALVDGELLAQREVLEREARSILRERADESQQVQGEVHPARSSGRGGGASSLGAVSSRSCVGWRLSGRGLVFGRDGWTPSPAFATQ